MTPREFHAYAGEVEKKQNSDFDDMHDFFMLNAYLNAAFKRAKKLPKLEKFLRNKKETNEKMQEQTPEQMFEMVKRWQAAYQKGR